MKIPIGKGERFIVNHAETKDRFIHTAAGVFKGKIGSADYHTDMICEKGYFHLCPRMDFLQTLHIIHSLYTNYENV